MPKNTQSKATPPIRSIGLVRPSLPKNQLQFWTLPNGCVMLDLDSHEMKFRIEMSTHQTRYEIGYIYKATGEESRATVTKKEYERARKLLGFRPNDPN